MAVSLAEYYTIWRLPPSLRKAHKACPTTTLSAPVHPHNGQEKGLPPLRAEIPLLNCPKQDGNVALDLVLSQPFFVSP